MGLALVTSSHTVIAMLTEGWNKSHRLPMRTISNSLFFKIINWSFSWMERKFSKFREAQFKDPVSHVCLAGAVVASLSLTLKVTSSNPFNEKYFIHWIQWKHLGKTQLLKQILKFPGPSYHTTIFLGHKMENCLWHHHVGSHSDDFILFGDSLLFDRRKEILSLFYVSCTFSAWNKRVWWN